MDVRTFRSPNVADGGFDGVVSPNLAPLLIQRLSSEQANIRYQFQALSGRRSPIDQIWVPKNSRLRLHTM